MSGCNPADVGNQLVADAIITRAGAITKLAEQCDVDFGLYLEPESERWSFGDDTPTRMVEAWLALKDAHAALGAIVGNAETLAADALGKDSVILGEHRYYGRTEKRRRYTPDQRRELTQRVTADVARTVAVNPVTGELVEERARVAGEAIREFSQRTTQGSGCGFRADAVKALGLDLDEFSEVTGESRKIGQAPA